MGCAGVTDSAEACFNAVQQSSVGSTGKCLSSEPKDALHMGPDGLVLLVQILQKISPIVS